MVKRKVYRLQHYEAHIRDILKKGRRHRRSAAAKVAARTNNRSGVSIGLGVCESALTCAVLYGQPIKHSYVDLERQPGHNIL